MKRLLIPTSLLLLIAAAASAQPPGPPPHGGPPIDEIASQLGLTDAQKTEVKRIFDEAHARMEAQREQMRSDVDQQLALILTPEQLEQFQALMKQGPRGGRRPPTEPSTIP